MKIRSLLFISLFLVFSIGSQAEAAAPRKPLKEKPATPAKEDPEPPPIKYFSDQKESLKGLKGIGIFIEPLNPEMEKSGVSKNQIREQVELKISQAGIRVINNAERLNEPGKPYLYVNLNAYSWREEVIYGYSLKVELNQLVLLDRDRMRGCFGPTWTTGSAGILGANKFIGFLREELAESLDKFVRDYLAVNPR
jgi:hypothetical protein